MLFNYVATDRHMYEKAWFILSACQLNVTPEIHLEEFVVWVFFFRFLVVSVFIDATIGSLIRKKVREKKGNLKRGAEF